MIRITHTLGLLTFVLMTSLSACARPGPLPDPRLLVNRAQIDQSPKPLLLSKVDTLGGGGTMIVLARRDGVVTWRTADFVTFSYRDGLLLATRGLGYDLMSADVSGTHAALVGEPKQDYARFATYLGPNDETLFRAFRCNMRNVGSDLVRSFDISFPAIRMEETCTSTGLQITNRYWIAPGGGVRRSLQWVGPELGYLETEQISRNIVE